MIEKDPKFIDNCSDSWIYDAEEWFHMHDDLQDDFISTQSVNDFKTMCRAIWKRHYDELYAYDDYSKIITYYKRKLVDYKAIRELKNSCKSVGKYNGTINKENKVVA